MLLLCDRISKSFSGFKVLDSVSFQINRCEIVGILGESGAGKTTLLRILRGVEGFDSGRIVFEDLEVNAESPKESFLELQRRTAIQLQRTFGLWPDSVVDNVVRALVYQDLGDEVVPQDEGEYEEYRARAMEVLKVVGLDGRADLWSGVLSGGEKQRLIVARQIARRPKLLLLDEPGTMTDFQSRAALIDALKRARDEYQMSVLFVSHNPAIHKSLADRVILLEKGKVSMEGGARNVVESFLSRLEEPLRKTKIPGEDVLRTEKTSKVYKLVPYGKVFELTETTLSFRSGEITGIVGPSGAGKTVIMRMLAGLELPDSGEVKIFYRGEWVPLGKFGRKSLRARRRIGILHQEFDLPYWSSVLELFAARLGIKDYRSLEEAVRRAERKGISDAVVDVLGRLAELPEGEMEIKLKEAGLDKSLLKEIFKEKDPEMARELAVKILGWFGISDDVLNKKTHQLSGGEKIRIALALSLVSNPKVLILDEPFGDLDPLTLRRVANLLKMIKVWFKPAIILVSHQLEFVEEVADRCILIREGKVIMDGEPKDVINGFLGEGEHGV
ncbi:MAG: ATP-binding cassette domain-containing protein [Candidatus Methanomethyliaceae archaeon]|nr:ATP-binding cassette domain-containing protein [Candidatus Methanomethyliaceae archaeon]